MKMSEMFETVLNELKVGDTARMVSSRRNEIAKVKSTRVVYLPFR